MSTSGPGAAPAALGLLSGNGLAARVCVLATVYPADSCLLLLFFRLIAKLPAPLAQLSTLAVPAAGTPSCAAPAACLEGGSCATATGRICPRWAVEQLDSCTEGMQAASRHRLPLVGEGRMQLGTVGGCHRRAGGMMSCCGRPSGRIGGSCCSMRMCCSPPAPWARFAPLLLPHRSTSTLGGGNLSTGSRPRKRSLRTGTTAAETSQVGEGMWAPWCERSDSGYGSRVYCSARA